MPLLLIASAIREAPLSVIILFDGNFNVVNSQSGLFNASAIAVIPEFRFFLS